MHSSVSLLACFFFFCLLSASFSISLSLSLRTRLLPCQCSIILIEFGGQEQHGETVQVTESRVSPLSQGSLAELRLCLLTLVLG